MTDVVEIKEILAKAIRIRLAAAALKRETEQLFSDFKTISQQLNNIDHGRGTVRQLR